MSNEWRRPDQPPPPLFLGKKERDLVKQVNDELIENVIGQDILYYPIDMARTDFNDAYGEAIVKTFLPPIRVYALIDFNDATTKYLEGAGVDKMWEITIHFHKRRLNEDQDLKVREGDFVLYGETYYEIMTLTIDTELFGQVEHFFEVSAVCKKARQGVFNAS